MAHITTNAHRENTSLGLLNIFRTIGDALVLLTESNSRVRRASELQALSDAELAKRGLKREDIARHVFGDMFFI